MQLEGTVTNVAAFGAFVDIGVHQDGLVHISELADRFVKDPREVVKVGDVVKVRVKEVDAERKRIALTMRSGAVERGAQPSAGGPRPQGAPANQSRNSAPPPRRAEPEGESALAAALRRAREGNSTRIWRRLGLCGRQIWPPATARKQRNHCRQIVTRCHWPQRVFTSRP